LFHGLSRARAARIIAAAWSVKQAGCDDPIADVATRRHLASLSTPISGERATTDLSGAAMNNFASRSELIVWRVDLVGPHGMERAVHRRLDGALVDAITQGS
jgi:hypothetical protein